MSGETNLARLLQYMDPVVMDGAYVFVCAADASYGDHVQWHPLASVQEPEGLTLVIKKSVADACGLAYTGVFRCIRLQVHSSLEAVGLTAAVAGCLAEKNISANVIAGFYHDHVLVPEVSVQQAMCALRSLADR